MTQDDYSPVTTKRAVIICTAVIYFRNTSFCLRGENNTSINITSREISYYAVEVQVKGKTI